jgi:hypothetical protein
VWCRRIVIDYAADALDLVDYAGAVG